MRRSLFAHLTMQFGQHPENLATEALLFILQQSKPARDAILQLAKITATVASSDLTFVSQSSGDDKARPDLVGRDALGGEPLLVEVKFWAGLTDNQPTTYLRRLTPGGTLLFVAPAARLQLLWGELRRRCESANVPLVKAPGTAGTFTAATGERNLVLVSWRELLAAIRRKVDATGDRRTIEDVDQLDSLCERMDEEEFLPVRGDELSAAHYKRVIQFNNLVDDIVEVLVNEKKVTTKGTKITPFAGVYGRYMLLRGAGTYFGCDLNKWMTLAATPYWLTIFGRTSREGPAPPHEALKAFAAANPGRVFSGRDGFPTVAILVPTGVEEHAVVRHVVHQISEIGELVAHLAAEPPVGEGSDAVLPEPAVDP